MNPARIFTLYKDGVHATLYAVTDLRWKVLSGTDLHPGEEVTPIRRISWTRASEKVNGKRTRVSPRSLVFVKIIGPVQGLANPVPRTEAEIERFLAERPFDPDRHPPTPAA